MITKSKIDLVNAITEEIIVDIQHPELGKIKKKFIIYKDNRGYELTKMYKCHIDSEGNEIV